MLDSVSSTITVHQPILLSIRQMILSLTPALQFLLNSTTSSSIIYFAPSFPIPFAPIFYYQPLIVYLELKNK